MKILIIANASSIHTTRWVDFFIKAGHVVHLISYIKLEKSIEGLYFHKLPNFFSNLYLDSFIWQVHIHIIILKIKPELIHAIYVSKFGWQIIPVIKRPIIISGLGHDILVLPKTNFVFYILTKLALKKADAIYAVSKHIKNVIISSFYIPSEKIRYFPLGVNINRFFPKSMQEEKSSHVIIIFSNRGLRDEYDPITIIDAITILSKQCSEIMVFLKGNGPERENVVNYVKQKGMEFLIQFRDRTEYSQVPDDYRNADIFISAAKSDGTPVSMLEAMASGLACIMTNVGGVPEWIQDGYNGLLFPPGRSDILAEKILFLINNPDERVRMGREARKTVVERGDWNTLMKVVEEDYYTLYQRYNPNHELE